MSDLTKRDAARLRDMPENAWLARQFLEGKTRENLADDSLLAYAVVHALQVMGEAANGVSPEAQAALPAIEWANIIGMRNRLVHAYNAINYDIVWAVVHDKLQPLTKELWIALRPIYPDLNK